MNKLIAKFKSFSMKGKILTILFVGVCAATWYDDIQNDRIGRKLSDAQLQHNMNEFNKAVDTLKVTIAN